MNEALVSLRTDHPQPEPDAVLLLRFSALGDVLLTAPAVEALHRAWPNAKLVYAIKKRLEHLVAHNPNVSEVLTLDSGEGPWSFAQRIRKSLAGKNVVVLDLHAKIRSVFLRALLPREWRRVIWHKRDFKDTLPVKLALKPYRASMLFADRYHAAVEEAVGRKLPRGELRAFLGPQDGLHAKEILQRAGVDLSRPIIGMSPGANWATKRWPAEKYSQLAREILLSGAQVVVQGSGDELTRWRPLSARARAIFADRTGWREARSIWPDSSTCRRCAASSRSARPSSPTTAGRCISPARSAFRRWRSSARPIRRCSPGPATTRCFAKASPAHPAHFSGGAAARADIFAA